MKQLLLLTPGCWLMPSRGFSTGSRPRMWMAACMLCKKHVIFSMKVVRNSIKSTACGIAHGGADAVVGLPWIWQQSSLSLNQCFASTQPAACCPDHAHMQANIWLRAVVLTAVVLTAAAASAVVVGLLMRWRPPGTLTVPPTTSSATRP